MTRIPRPENPQDPQDKFAQVASRDTELTALLRDKASLEYRMLLLEEHGPVSAEMLEQAQTLENQVLSREENLRNSWREVGGDEGAYHLLVRMRDWQAIAETEVDPLLRENATQRFLTAREEYQDYRYEQGWDS